MTLPTNRMIIFRQEPFQKLVSSCSSLHWVPPWYLTHLYSFHIDKLLPPRASLRVASCPAYSSRAAWSVNNPNILERTCFPTHIVPVVLVQHSKCNWWHRYVAFFGSIGMGNPNMYILRTFLPWNYKFVPLKAVRACHCWTDADGTVGMAWSDGTCVYCSVCFGAMNWGSKACWIL